MAVRLARAMAVERRLGAPQLEHAERVRRDDAQILRQQAQDAEGRHRIAAERVPHHGADDLAVMGDVDPPKRGASFRMVLNSACRMRPRASASGKAAWNRVE